jgi:small subunit ribosomal protein S6
MRLSGSPVRIVHRTRGSHIVPLYENVFIARQDATPAQVEALTENFANVIAQHGGNVGKREYWGLRSLAYRIKKNRKGHYTLLNIDAPAAAVTEMERLMRINEDVIRYLTVRVEALEEGPSAMLRSRDRDDRDRRGPRDRDDRGGYRGDRDREDRGGYRGDRDREDRSRREARSEVRSEADAPTETQGDVA